MSSDANQLNLLKGNHQSYYEGHQTYFISLNYTLALLIVPSLADSLPYFGKDMDLCLAYNMEEGTMESIQIKYLNLINLMYAFKNVRNMEKFLEENAHASDGTQPILTRETMAYAISLSISCVCLHANDDILKGRASAAYERAMSDLECTSDDMSSVNRGVLNLSKF